MVVAQINTTKWWIQDPHTLEPWGLTSTTQLALGKIPLELLVEKDNQQRKKEKSIAYFAHVNNKGLTFHKKRIFKVWTITEKLSLLTTEMALVRKELFKCYFCFLTALLKYNLNIIKFTPFFAYNQSFFSKFRVVQPSLPSNSRTFHYIPCKKNFKNIPIRSHSH